MSFIEYFDKQARAIGNNHFKDGDERIDSKGTPFGGCLSFIVTATVLIYAGDKLSTMVRRDDNKLNIYYRPTNTSKVNVSL